MTLTPADIREGDTVIDRDGITWRALADAKQVSPHEVSVWGSNGLGAFSAIRVFKGLYLEDRFTVGMTAWGTRQLTLI